jgi:hypothetical protein
MSTPDNRDLLDRNSGQDESILDLLFESYNERIGFDNAEIRQAFEDLYAAMNGKPLREQDEVIYAACAVCSAYAKDAFRQGFAAGMRLKQEVDLLNE